MTGWEWGQISHYSVPIQGDPTPNQGVQATAVTLRSTAAPDANR